MIRFVDATGLLGNAMVIAAFASRVPGLSGLGLGARRAVVAAVLVLALVPLGSGLPLAGYLRGATGDLSITSLLLLTLYLLRYKGTSRLPPQASGGRDALLALVVLTAVVLYPMALGWGSFDPYRLGYGSYGMLAVLLLLALAAVLLLGVGVWPGVAIGAFVLNWTSGVPVLAAGAVESPYAQLGASRELILLVAMEPLLVLAVIAYGVAAGSFSTAAIAHGPSLIFRLPTLGLTLAVLLAATLRKSPFDLASSHHAHQELVKGSTTEMAGRWLAVAELGRVEASSAIQ